MVVDFGFGLSQLSGDESLLIMLLAKIKTEYSDCDNKLKTMFDNKEWDQAKVLIHTLKGVAGNLGCKQLYTSAKQMEDELKSVNACPSVFPKFADTLHATMALIQKAEDAGTVEIGDDEEPSNEIKELVSMLESNAYISRDKLVDLLAATRYDDDTKQQLTLAIDTLDYAFALELLNS